MENQARKELDNFFTKGITTVNPTSDGDFLRLESYRMALQECSMQTYQWKSVKECAQSIYEFLTEKQ